MSMTVAQMIERLQEMDPEAEVRLATQPSWPLEYHVAGVASQQEIVDYKRAEEKCDEHGFYNCDECEPETSEEDGNIVWIAEGSQIGYAQRAVWEVASV